MTADQLKAREKLDNEAAIAATKADRQWNATLGPQTRANYRSGFRDGYRDAATLREKEIATLRARVAELESQTPKLVTNKEFEEYAGRWWLVATFEHYGDLLLIVPMNQPIPAPETNP